MVVEIDGVWKVVVPVPPVKIEPPLDAAYQSTVSPAPGEANIKTLPVPQRELSVPVGAAGTGLMVAVNAVLALDLHPVVEFLVSA